MQAKVSLDDVINRDWERRAASLEQVKKKLRTGWRNDSAVLNQYFQSCVANWKVYKGHRAPKQVLKLQSVYKQALYGDNLEAPPADLETPDGQKWKGWYALRGTTKDTAKRRFITLLSEIDPLLIDVMPDEKPPVGFPLNRKGIPICAKCNTVVGCIRPITDDNRINLRQQLFETPELHEPENFKLWVKYSLENQRCVWGAHQAISSFHAKPFMDWFNRDENRGFFPYDSSTIFFIMKELIVYQHEVTYDLMQRRAEFEHEPEVYNQQVIKTLKLKTLYEEISGDTYEFEVPCTRDIDLCNSRRTADGGKNHSHKIELDPPTTSDTSSMEEAIELRIQCQKLGISPSTGVVKDIATRCEIYRQRIADHFEALRVAAEAKARNEARSATRATDKKKVKELSAEMMRKQLWDACHMNLVDHTMLLVRRGGNPNEQSPRGVTPIICLVLNNAPVEQFEELIEKLKANVNMVNKNGMTALMIACRMNEQKLIHALMRNDAFATQSGGRGWCALHHCVIHGCEEITRMIVEYLKESAGDSLRVARFLDAQSEDGETPLMLAARRRNGVMCLLLTNLGANPNVRDKNGRNASYIARHAGWSEISDWLAKKVGAGVSKLQTYSDLQFEKQVRYGIIKVREMIEQFGHAFLTLLQDRVSLHPLGCPNVAKFMVRERGDAAIAEQTAFVNNYQNFILHRHQTAGRSSTRSSRSSRSSFAGGSFVAATSASAGAGAGSAEGNTAQPRKLKPSDIAHIVKMKECVGEMAELMRKGMTNPNAESLAKPLPWTPLMCAVVINDLRSVKLMMREGADPNHPNCAGTTVVMLAAQLNNLHMLVELLVSGKGDVNAVDSEGFSVMAYATSLPLPTVMQETPVESLLNNDTNGQTKLLNSSDILKHALSSGIGQELKDTLAEGELKANPENVGTQVKFLRLLEQFGLTRIETERHLHDQARSTDWRVRYSEADRKTGPEAALAAIQQAASEEDEELLDEYQREALLKYKQMQEDELRAQLEEEERKSKEGLRCPICTLFLPCSHFFKVASLERYLEKQKREEEANTASAAAVDAAERALTFTPKKKMKTRNRRQDVLIETHLNDRNTDRSIELVKKYREKDLALERARCERFLIEQREEEDQEGEEQVAMLVITQADREDRLVLADVDVKKDQKTIEPAEPVVAASTSRKGLSSAPSSEAEYMHQEGVDGDDHINRDDDRAKDDEDVEREDGPTGLALVAISPSSFGSSSLHAGGEARDKIDKRDKRDERDCGTETDTAIDTGDRLIAHGSHDYAAGKTHWPTTAAAEAGLHQDNVDPSTSAATLALVPINYETAEALIVGPTAVADSSQQQQPQQTLYTPRGEEVKGSHHSQPSLALALIVKPALKKESNFGEGGQIITPQTKRIRFADKPQYQLVETYITNAEYDWTAGGVPVSPSVLQSEGEEDGPAPLLLTYSEGEGGGGGKKDVEREVEEKTDTEAAHPSLSVDEYIDWDAKGHRDPLADEQIGESAQENLLTPLEMGANTDQGGESQDQWGGLDERQEGADGGEEKQVEQQVGEEEGEERAPSITIPKVSSTEAMGVLMAGLSPTRRLEIPVTANPVPLDSRRVYMFTKEPLTKNMGTADSRPITLAGYKSGDRNARVAVRQSSGKRLEKEKKGPEVNISGWIFVPMSSLQSEILPLESVSLSLDKWGSILEHIRSKFIEEWVPQLSLEPLVDARTWKPLGPRCIVCSIGFVRFHESLQQFRQLGEHAFYTAYYARIQAASSSSSPLHHHHHHHHHHHLNHDEDSGAANSRSSSFSPTTAAIAAASKRVAKDINSAGEKETVEHKMLCVPCLIRQELYEKVKQTLSRALRQRLSDPHAGDGKNTTWPFTDRHKSLPLSELVMQQHLAVQSRVVTAMHMHGRGHAAGVRGEGGVESIISGSVEGEGHSEGPRKLTVKEAEALYSERAAGIYRGGDTSMEPFAAKAGAGPAGAGMGDEVASGITAADASSIITFTRSPIASRALFDFDRMEQLAEKEQEERWEAEAEEEMKMYPDAYARHMMHKRRAAAAIANTAMNSQTAESKAILKFTASFGESRDENNTPSATDRSTSAPGRGGGGAARDILAPFHKNTVVAVKKDYGTSMDVRVNANTKQLGLVVGNWKVDTAAANKKAKNGHGSQNAKKQHNKRAKGAVRLGANPGGDSDDEDNENNERDKNALDLTTTGVAGQEQENDAGDGRGVGAEQFDDDLSVGSHVSSITNSLAPGGDGTSLLTQSSISTLTVLNPVRRPKEMTLLPFLVSKGHYEEVERTVRIALGKRAVDEGEGMLQLFKIFSAQAEMYKQMGLWPLAVATYMDCVDLSAMLLGYTDFLTLQSITRTTSSLRKMGVKELAKWYIDALCHTVDENSLKTLKNDIIKTIKEHDRSCVKNILANHALWLNRFKPKLPVGRNDNNKSSRGRGGHKGKFSFLSRPQPRERISNSVGIAGLYTLLTSASGFCTIVRTDFLHFCATVPPVLPLLAEQQQRPRQQGQQQGQRIGQQEVGVVAAAATAAGVMREENQAGQQPQQMQQPTDSAGWWPTKEERTALPLFAQFVDHCFRLRTSDDIEVYRFLVQYLIQKHLSKKFAATSEVARQYRALTSRETIENVLQFIKFGVPLPVSAFDDLLELALRVLAPAYKEYVLRAGAFAKSLNLSPSSSFPRSFSHPVSATAAGGAAGGRGEGNGRGFYAFDTLNPAFQQAAGGDFLTELVAEAYDAYVTMLQRLVRVVLAKKKVARVRKEVHEEMERLRLKEQRMAKQVRMDAEWQKSLQK